MVRLILALAVACLLTSCAAAPGLHGNVNTGYTQRGNDPKSGEFHIGGQINFAKKRPKAGGK